MTFNVVDLGALDTDAQDTSTLATNATAINSAIAAGHPVIWIPQGVRHIRSDLDPHDHLTVIDDGRGTRMTNKDYWWRPSIGMGMVCSHHGLQANAPNNTMFGASLAARSGLRWQEFDINFASNGTPMCIHDATVDAATANT